MHETGKFCPSCGSPDVQYAGFVCDGCSSYVCKKCGFKYEIRKKPKDNQN
jgi:transposase-like protein